MLALARKKSGSPRQKIFVARRKVVNGTAASTPGGLARSDILVLTKKSRDGTVHKRYVSKTKHNSAKKSPWMKAVAKAKKSLGIKKKSFVLVGGKSPQGKALYAAAKKHYKAMY